MSQSSPVAFSVPFDKTVKNELAADNVQDAIDELTDNIDAGTPNKFAGYSATGALQAIPSFTRNAVGGVDVNQTLPLTDIGSTQSFILNQYNGVFNPTNDLTNTYLYGQIHTYQLQTNFDYASFTGDEMDITSFGNGDISDIVGFFPRIQLGSGGAGTSITSRAILASIRESGSHIANSLRPIEAQSSIDGGATTQEVGSYFGSTYVGGTADFAYGSNIAVQVAGTVNANMTGLNINMTIDPGATTLNGYFINSSFNGDIAGNFYGVNQGFSGDITGNSYDLNFSHDGDVTGFSASINMNHNGTITGDGTGISLNRGGPVSGGFTSISSYLNSSATVGTDFRFINLSNDALVSNNSAGTLIFNNGTIAKSWTGYGQYMNCDIGDGTSNIVGHDVNFQSHILNGTVTGYNFNNSSTANGPIYGLNVNNSGNFTGDFTAVNVSNNATQTGTFNIQGLNFSNSGAGYRFNGANIFHNANMTEEILGYRFNSTGDSRTATGLDISMQGNITDDAQGIRVNVNNLTSSSTTNHVHSLDVQGGVVSIQSTATPFSGANVDIGNNFTCTTTIANGFPLTGTDQIIQLFQSNLLVNDDIATGPFGLNTTMIGMATQVVVGSGKTIPLLRSMLLGTTVPDGSGGTITEHVVLEVLGLPSFGGSVTCPTKTAIQDSQLLGQNFSDGTAEAWFIKNQDPNTENHLSKLAIATTTKKVSNSAIGLEVDATKYTWLGSTVIGGGSFTAPTDALEVIGNISIGQAGNGLKIKEGSNAKLGADVLVAGSVTVNNTSVTASSRIFVTIDLPGGTVGSVYATNIIAGTSFDINSTSPLDTSTVAWMIIEAA
jgi:hypothetical protein